MRTGKSANQQQVSNVLQGLHFAAKKKKSSVIVHANVINESTRSCLGELLDLSLPGVRALGTTPGSHEAVFLRGWNCL